MRIITWNCTQQFRTKVNAILEERPDILVVQECEAGWGINLVNLFLSLDAEHFGWVKRPHNENRKKDTNLGVGVFTFKEYTLERLTTDSDAHPDLAMPLRIRRNGVAVFDLLAVWSDYAYEKYEPGINPGAYGVEFFKDLFRLPLVVAGDFNSPINYKHKGKSGFLYAHTVLTERGLVKAYNVATGEELFKESQATFYRNYQRRYPRHIDHIYVPIEWRSAIVTARCGEHDKWVSDDVAHRSNHAPLIVEIDDAIFQPGPQCGT